MSEAQARLIRATIEVIDEVGVERASLRSIAARVGVSHQSVAHHFGDSTGLYTAVATAGFTDLLTASQAAAATLPADQPLGVPVATLGNAYIAFAQTNSASFHLMFGSRLVNYDDPSLLMAQAAVWQLLLDTVAVEVDRGWGAPLEAEQMALACWAITHGVARLQLDLPPSLRYSFALDEVLFALNRAIVINPTSTQ